MISELFLVYAAGSKGCDIPKVALSALHAGVNSGGPLSNPSSGGHHLAEVSLNGGTARLHVSTNLCDVNNSLQNVAANSGHAHNSHNSHHHPHHQHHHHNNNNNNNSALNNNNNNNNNGNANSLSNGNNSHAYSTGGANSGTMQQQDQVSSYHNVDKEAARFLFERGVRKLLIINKSILILSVYYQ